MEELEPWNMFTNDFVADETDPEQLLADANAIIGEYEKGETAKNGNEENNGNDDEGESEEENNSNLLIPEVTMGGDGGDGDVGGDDGDVGGDDGDVGGDDGDGERSNSNSQEGVHAADHDGNSGSGAAVVAAAAAAADGDDDNAIFNFDVAPLPSSTTDRPKRQSAGADNSMSRKELESLINYDNAIVYMCPACGCEFGTQDQWKRHINGIHSFNTRRGLNFVQIDKLYHECLECHKHIAMHSMENLLKHKYTHLPYRCAKCKFCMRQYKYRQDLTVHLRTQHHAELVKMAKAAKENFDRTANDYNNHRPTPNGRSSLEIRDIRENAIDAFGFNSDGVRVKNEIIDTMNDSDLLNGTTEQSSSSLLLPSFLEDALSRGSSKNSNQQSNDSGNGGNGESTNCEKQIQFICPDCGQEYGTQNQWQHHIVSVHNYGTRQGLNFEEINYNRQARCLECQEIIPVNVIHHLQQHKFTHLPHKAWLRCKLCFKTFISRTDILKHLLTDHPNTDSDNRSSGHYSRNKDLSTRHQPDNDFDESQDADWDADDSLLMTPSTNKSGANEQHSSEMKGHFDAYIDYMCPTCGKEFRIKKLWRKHIVQVHKLTTLEILNFKNINEREVMCLECGKVITNAYGIQNAQQHYFTHMPFKSFIRCRLCGKSYTDRKGLVKHLRGKHFGRPKLHKPIDVGGEGGGGGGGGGHTKSSLNYPIRKTPQVQHQLRAPMPSIQQNQHQQLQQQQKSNQLLSQALQRPQKRPNDSPSIAAQGKKLRQTRPKEIVKHKNYVFEIAFLEEEDAEDDADDDEVGLVNAAADEAEHDGDEVLLVPEISTGNGNGRQLSFNGRERCADCGSIFTTQEALRAHIRKEHDFNGGAYGRAISPTNEKIKNNDDDDDEDALLVPSGVASIEYGHSTPWPKSSTNEAERHFSYLCPSCGVEHYSQMDWRRHINGVHNFDKREYLNFRQLDQYRYQCTICQDIVTKSKLKALQDHKFRHLPYKSYLKCKYCGTLYNHKPNMYGHLQVRHNIVCINRSTGNENDADYPSPRVAVKAPQQQASYHHHQQRLPTINNRHHQSMGYHGAPLSIASSSSSMKSSQSGNATLPKPPGLKTVEDVITFHNAVDHATITYFCPSCNENFDSHVFWRKHIVEEHNLNSKEGLNFRQIDEHHYLCLQCYKRVTVTHTKGAIGQLQSHKFRHLPYRSFKCLNCNGEFVRKQMFFKHLNRATNRCENAAAGGGGGGGGSGGVNNAVTQPSEKSARNGGGGGGVSDDVALADVPDDEQQNSTNSVNSGLIVNQDAFMLVCPQCGEEFESQRYWREHININHDLGKREKLRFKKISPHLHTCLECGERVNGRKLRDLQIHRFKHLPFGPYIQCKFCQTGYNNIRNMQDHLRQKHPNVVQKHDEYTKMEEMRLYEESSMTDAESLGGSSVVNEAELDEEEAEQEQEHEEDIDQVEVIPDIEEGEDDDQYLLG